MEDIYKGQASLYKTGVGEARFYKNGRLGGWEARFYKNGWPGGQFLEKRGTGRPVFIKTRGWEARLYKNGRLGGPFL